MGLLIIGAALAGRTFTAIRHKRDITPEDWYWGLILACTAAGLDMALR